MKKYCYIFAVVAIVAISSCTKDNLTGNESSVKVEMSINASVELQAPENGEKNEGETRLYVNDKKVYWASDDKLAVFGSDNLSEMSVFSLKSGEDTQSAEFTGENVSGDDIIAVYPSSMIKEGSAVTEAGGIYSVPVTIPSEQTYGSNGFPVDANLAIAVGDAGNLAFKNAMGILKLNVYASKKRIITSMQLAADEQLWGDATLSSDGSGAPVLEFDGTPSAESKTITLNFPDGGLSISSDANNPTTIYLVVPAGALANGFTVSLRQSSGTMAFLRTKIAQTITRNVIKNMSSTQAAFNCNLSNIANTYIVVGETGTVNIYPVKSDGNLVGHVNKFAINVNSPNGSLTSYVSGYCKFTAKATGSWSQVAAYDSNSKILWSWVMWLCPTQPTDVTLSDGSVILDRNLCAVSGETSATKAQLRGLYYQWGRKDPLVNYTTADRTIETSEEIGTVEYVTEHPNYFIVPSGTTNSNDWHWQVNDDLWGASKTIYDPCPAGYKVPDGTASTSFWQACGFNNNKGTYDSDLSGYGFKVKNDPDDPLFLVNGYVAQKDNAGAVYAGGYYWCYNSVTMKDETHYSRAFKFTTTAVTEKSNAPRYYGCQIRCQKIN